MSQVSRYILRHLLLSLAGIALTLTCVVWLTQSLRYIELIINRGLSVSLFVYLTILLLPAFFGIILPIAQLVAVMFTYNKLTMDSEVVALRAAGFSPLALARPALVLALAVTMACYLLTLYFMPKSYREFADLQLTIRNSFAGILLQEGVFSPVRDGITAFVRSRSPDGELLGIIVHDSRDKKRPVTIMAERGAIVRNADDLHILMVNGSRQEVAESDGRLNMLYFDRYSIDVGSDQKSASTRSRDPRERYLDELFLPRHRATDAWNYHKLRMEGHDRLSAPLLGLAFPLIALSILLCGDFNRRGQMWRIVAGVLVCSAVQASQLGVKAFAEKSPALMPLMYAVPALAIMVSGYVLLNGGWKPMRRPRLLPSG